MGFASLSLFLLLLSLSFLFYLLFLTHLTLLCDGAELHIAEVPREGSVCTSRLAKVNLIAVAFNFRLGQGQKQFLHMNYNVRRSNDYNTVATELFLSCF